MRVIYFGSPKINQACLVDRFVRPGKTIPRLEYTQFGSGKGINPSIALARAGAAVFHNGKSVQAA